MNSALPRERPPLVLTVASCTPCLPPRRPPAPLPWPFAPLPPNCPNDLAQVASCVEKVLQGNKSPCYQPGPQVCAQRPSLGVCCAVPPPPPAVRQNCRAVCIVCLCVVGVMPVCDCACVTACGVGLCAGLCVCVLCVCVTTVCVGVCAWVGGWWWWARGRVDGVGLGAGAAAVDGGGWPYPLCWLKQAL